MDAEIRHGPAFAAIFVTLRPGERITVESGGMASMSAATAMRTRFNGGFFRAIARKLVEAVQAAIRHPAPTSA